MQEEAPTVLSASCILYPASAPVDHPVWSIDHRNEHAHPRHPDPALEAGRDRAGALRVVPGARGGGRDGAGRARADPARAGPRAHVPPQLPPQLVRHLRLPGQRGRAPGLHRAPARSRRGGGHPRAAAGVPGRRGPGGRRARLFRGHRPRLGLPAARRPARGGRGRGGRPDTGFSTARQFEDCIECGACVSACPVDKAQPGFMGPAALAAANAQRRKHPADEPALLALAGSERGEARCERALRCSQVCPTGVYPARHIMELQAPTAFHGPLIRFSFHESHISGSNTQGSRFQGSS